MKLNVRQVVFGLSALATGLTFLIWTKNAFKVEDCTYQIQDTNRSSFDLEKLYEALQNLCEENAASERKASTVASIMSASSAMVFSALACTKLKARNVFANQLEEDSRLLLPSNHDKNQPPVLR